MFDSTIYGRARLSTSTLERTAAGLANDASRQGELETFYRGAGVEEHLIDYFRTRIGCKDQSLPELAVEVLGSSRTKGRTNGIEPG